MEEEEGGEADGGEQEHQVQDTKYFPLSAESLLPPGENPSSFSNTYFL